MEIYIKRGEEQFGPFTTEQVEESLQNGSLIESDIAWHAALPDWVPVNEILASPKSAVQPAPETAPDISAPRSKSGGNKKVMLAVAAVVIVLAAAAAIVLPKVLSDGENENQPASPGPTARENPGAPPSAKSPTTPGGTADKTGGSGAVPPTPAVPPPGQPATLPVAAGDSTTSFTAVTKHLDAGGTFFFYLSTQQAQDWVQMALGEGGKLLEQFAPDLGPDAELAATGFEVAKSLYTESGLASIDGIGASTMEMGDGLKRNVAMIHHDPTRGDGILWKAFGSAPHDIAAMKLMPAETAYAVHGDLDLAAIQAWLKKMIAKNAPDLAPMVDEQLENPLWQNILGSYSGEVGLYITLDPNKTIELPIGGLGGIGEEGIGNPPNITDLKTEPAPPSLPGVPPPLPGAPPLGGVTPSLPPLPPGVDGGPIVPPGVDGQNIKFPQPGLILTLKVRNDDILTKIQETVGELGLQMKPVDVAGVTVHQLPQMDPLPFPLQPSLFKLGDYLVITSDPEMAAKVIAVHTGAEAGLKGTAEFQKLARGMEMKGNQFSFVSGRVTELFGDVIKQSLDAQGGGLIPAPLKELAVKFSTIGMSGQISIMQVTPQGFLIQTQTEGMGYDTAALALGAGVPILMGASLAVPALMGGGFATEEDPAIVMEVKFSQGRLLATGLIQANQINGQLPDGKMWCDDVLKIVRDPKQFVDPVMIDPSNPDEKICTWLFNKHLSGAKLGEVSAPKNTVLIFAAESLEWNGSGDNADFPVDVGDVITVFVDGHVENISQADLPRLKWKP
jgi:hypothetical protein